MRFRARGGATIIEQRESLTFPVYHGIEDWRKP